MHLFVCPLHSQVFAPYVLCLFVKEPVTACACVGGLALVGISVIPYASSLSLSVPPTCLWHTCVVRGLTPAFVNRGRRRVHVIGAQEGREKGLHSEKPTEMRKRWTDG